MSIQVIHDYLSVLLLMLLGLSAILAWKNYLQFPKHFKLFTIYIGITFIFELISFITSLRKESNLWLIHLYTLTEFILLGLFYKSVLKRPQWLNQNFKLILLVGSVLVIANTLFLQPITQFNSYAETMENIILIGFSISLFFHIINEESELYQSKALKWINSGILLYLSGSLFIFLFSQYSMDILPDHFLHYLWLFNLILNLIFKVIIIFAVLKMISESKTSVTSL